MPFAENIEVFFADFGVSASWGAQSGFVLIDAPTEDFLGGRVLSTEYVMTMPAARFPGIAMSATITVGADSYRVTEVRFTGDGSVKELSVKKQ